MEIKAVLLVVSAIVAVAAASPLEELVAKASIVRRYDCNENAIHYTSIGYRNYALKGCTTRHGTLCVDGLPYARCSRYITPSQCYYFYWYAGTFSWSAVICQQPFSSGHCYKTGSIYNCRDVAQQQEEEEEETTEGPGEGVQICEVISGVKECSTLPEGKNAALMQAPDCFCVKDSGDKKACVPDNCDAGRVVP